ncbi:MAG: YfhO family protein [Clostridiales bacterium]|jgi:hypothetical protein|nr:YfhO family protein [Clostridiales bacterium]
MKKTIAATIAKGTALLLLDGVTLWLLFVYWRLAGHSVGLWALVFLAISLAALHILSLMPRETVRKIHMKSTAPLIALSFVYYLLIMAQIRLTYLWMSSRWFLVISLVMLAFFLIFFISLYMSGRSVVLEDTMTADRPVSFRQIQTLLLNMDSAVHHAERALDERQYATLRRAFETMKDEVEFSTPFGRSFSPVIVDMERSISQQMEKTGDEIAALSHRTGSAVPLETIEEELLAIAQMIKKKELQYLQGNDR